MKYLVFTDVDGTLIDHDTYSYLPAAEAIVLLREKGVPLVLVSSKTLPELKALHKELSLTSPIIFENGGGIFWPAPREIADYTGLPCKELMKHVPLLRELLSIDITFLTDMSPEEASEATGLPLERARLSQQREVSLPFIIHQGATIGSDELMGINSSLGALGLAVIKGGRFFHFLSNQSDKGRAVKKIIEYYEQERQGALRTIGIGDSENDIPMLRAVEIPVIVKKKDGTSISTGLPTIVTTRGIGPAGFAEAVESIITEQS